MTDSIVARKCFIYSIESSSGKRYIGSTLKPKYRMTSHLKTAEQMSHRSPTFQAEFNVVGRHGFRMVVLAIVPEDLRQVYEDIYIRLYKPELNAVQAAVPFKNKAHIDKVNAARKSKPTYSEHLAKANAESSKIVRRKVRCVETGQVFNSIQDARAFAGGSRLGVALQKPSCTAYGYHWEYADDNYRPRSKGNAANKVKIVCIETGDVFEGHAPLIEWFASKGVVAEKPTLSQALTKGYQAYGHHFKRI